MGSCLTTNVPKKTLCEAGGGVVLRDKKKQQFFADDSHNIIRVNTGDGMKIKLIEQVGSGARAIVWKAAYVSTGEYIAVKVSRSDDPFLEREYYNLKQLCHKNIIQPVLFHHEHVMETNKLTKFMVIPLLARDLFTHAIEEEMDMGESEFRKLLLDIGGALRYMHDEHHMVHGDVKPENIMLDDGGNFILCDFGSAGKCDTKKMDSFNGTVNYMSPETASSYRHSRKINFTVGKPSDIYALGLTIHNIAARGDASHGQGNKTMYEWLSDIECHDTTKQISSLPERFSESFKELLTMMTFRSPVARITASEIFNHPFMVAIP